MIWRKEKGLADIHPVSRKVKQRLDKLDPQTVLQYADNWVSQANSAVWRFDRDADASAYLREAALCLLAAAESLEERSVVASGLLPAGPRF